MQIVSEEVKVQNLLEKGAIKFSDHESNEFISNIFLVNKKREIQTSDQLEKSK